MNQYQNVLLNKQMHLAGWDFRGFQSGFVTTNKDKRLVVCWGMAVFIEALTRPNWLSGLSLCQLPMLLTLKKHSGDVHASDYTLMMDMAN